MYPACQVKDIDTCHQMCTDTHASPTAEAEPGLDMGAISKTLAELWKATSYEDKAPYQVLRAVSGSQFGSAFDFESDSW